MTDSSLIEKACQIIEDNLGRDVADSYRHFYEGEDEQTILSSLEEIFVELMGEQVAKNKLAEIFGNKNKEKLDE